jgi:hypothetical protein
LNSVPAIFAVVYVKNIQSGGQRKGLSASIA